MNVQLHSTIKMTMQYVRNDQFNKIRNHADSKMPLLVLNFLCHPSEGYVLEN